MTPHGVAAVTVTTPSSTPSTRHESSGKSKSSSSHRHSSSKSSNHQSVVAASSPSSVSSVSSGSQSDPHSPGAHGDESNSKNANAPQIYPWMKRVHLGQSKSIPAHLRCMSHFFFLDISNQFRYRLRYMISSSYSIIEPTYFGTTSIIRSNPFEWIVSSWRSFIALFMMPCGIGFGNQVLSAGASSCDCITHSYSMLQHVFQTIGYH